MKKKSCMSHKGVITIWICKWAIFAYDGNSVDAIISSPAAVHRQLQIATQNLQLQTKQITLANLSTPIFKRKKLKK